MAEDLVNYSDMDWLLREVRLGKGEVGDRYLFKVKGTGLLITVLELLKVF